jgi:hypothetical protein
MRFYRLVGMALVAVACSSSSTEIRTPGAVALRFINATNAPVDALVDGQAVAHGIAIAAVAGPFDVGAGTHAVRLQTSGGASATLSVNATAGQSVTAFAYATNSGFSADVLPDTGAIVPVGKTKVRVTHLAADAPPLDIWRTQPDYQTAIHVMTPFTYLAVSPYLQSDAGSWELWVSPQGASNKLATTGAFDVPAGERRTVVVLDSAGTVVLKVISE